MWKISKFTKMVENSNRELLLYNSYIGENSLCKLTDLDNIEIILSGDIEKVSDKSIESFISDDRFYISFFTVKDIEGTAVEELKKDILDNKRNPMKRIYDLIYENSKSLNLAKELLNPGMSLCYGGKRDNFVIKADGSVYKCTIDFEDKKNQVGILANGKMTLFDKYYNYISDRYKCAEYYECFFAPVCTGDPCPKKDSKQKNCSFLKENMEIVLCIMDKYSGFEVIDGGMCNEL